MRAGAVMLILEAVKKSRSPCACGGWGSGILLSLSRSHVESGLAVAPSVEAPAQPSSWLLAASCGLAAVRGAAAHGAGNASASTGSLRIRPGEGEREPRTEQRWLLPFFRRLSVVPEEAAPATSSEVLPEAKRLFERCWSRVEAKYGKNVPTVKEVVWLNGAPGSGKGANTRFILESRGLGRAVTMSEILKTFPAARAFIDEGGLVPDEVVVNAVLDVLFDPERDDGFGLIVDGFPRTDVQADILKLLYDKLKYIHNEHVHANDAHLYPHPSFKVVVLYVNEAESIKRQRLRAVKSTLTIERAKDAGTDNVWPVRASDVDERICAERYKTFKRHYHALLRLKSFFPFHLIDAMGTLEDTRRQIAHELRYQSSTDLEEKTYMSIRHLPMAKELCHLVRQQLTARLDSYALQEPENFLAVIEIIDDAVMPLLRRCGMAGEALFVTKERLFLDEPVTIDMLIDILSDRGFHVSYSPIVQERPYQFEFSTGAILVKEITYHRFKITFRVSSVRDVIDQSSNWGSAGAHEQPDISTSFVPSGFDHQMKYTQPRDELTRRTLHLDDIGSYCEKTKADQSVKLDELNKPENQHPLEQMTTHSSK